MKDIILKRLRRIYKKSIGHPAGFIDPDTGTFDLFGQAAADLIHDTLLSDRPCMICRMGNTEMTTVMTFLAIQSNDTFLRKAINYIRGKTESFWWDPKIVNLISVYSGFFPATESNLVRFCNRIIQDAGYADILGSWIQTEAILFRSNTKLKKIPLIDLEPFRYPSPWSRALKGLKVLVIHPFEQSIQSQYSKRVNIFANPDVLPEFELITLKAVQSVAKTGTTFSDWFEALHWMEEQTEKIQFDVAIIGAGAYGFPLAAHIKRTGKKAIHLGGITQLLFGIKGNRWDKNPLYKNLFNKHWVRPLQNEVPLNATLVENACYW